MKSINALMRLLALLCLLSISVAGATTIGNNWKKEIIKQGQIELRRVQAQNARNDAAGNHHLNQYVVIISTAAVYPNGDFIRQEKGAGQGEDASYILSPKELGELDGRLRAINTTSEIDTYVLVVNYMPMEFVVDIPDNIEIKAFFEGSTTDIVQMIAQPVSNLANDIVTGITHDQLSKVTKPTLYCGLVKFKVYKNAKLALSHWVYYPHNTITNFKAEYKNLLNGYVRNHNWKESDNQLVKSMVTLIDQANTNFRAVQTALPDFLSIVNQAPMLQKLKSIGNVGLSALGLADRVHALKILSKLSMDDETELWLLDLLKTTPQADYIPLQDSLLTVNQYARAPNTMLLNGIIGTTQDAILLWGENNYRALMQTLAHLVTHASNIGLRKEALLTKAIDEGKIFIWDKSYALKFFTTPPVGINSFSVDWTGDGNFTVRRQYVASHACQTKVIDNGDYGTYTSEGCTANWSDETEVRLHPFELVGFVNRSDLAMLEGIGTPNTGDLVLVPAIMLKYAQDKKFNNNAATAFFMTLDAVTILVPVTKIYNLARIVQRIYLGLDLAAAAGSAGNLTVNMLAGNTSFDALVQKYNLVMAVVNVMSITSGTRLAASVAGEFMTEINQPGIRESIAALATNGNKNAAEILALERELLAQGRVAGVTWTKVLTHYADLTDDALYLGNDLARAKTYLLKTKPAAGTIDLVVHGTGNSFVLVINGVEKTFDPNTLAAWLKTNGYNKSTIRLLSCSSIKSAEELSDAIGQTVIAVEGDVRIYADGGIASVGDHSWYTFTPGEMMREAPKPRAPANLNEDFVVMGRASTAVATWFDTLPAALKADIADPNSELAKLFANATNAKRTGLVEAWNKLDDAGLTVLRKDPVQLQKFDDIVKNNNLGLDADGLGDLLKSPQAKGLTWDNPDKVLEAVKRSSDANIQGLSISHKKFPAPANGTDNFVLKNARQYQAEASGDAALSFNKRGVSFDNVAPDGKLVDRKFGHGASIFDEYGEVINKARSESLLDQAKRQLDAVGGDGSKIRWEIATETGANGIEQLFFTNKDAFPGIEHIEVIHVVQQTIIP